MIEIQILLTVFLSGIWGVLCASTIKSSWMIPVAAGGGFIIGTLIKVLNNG